MYTILIGPVKLGERCLPIDRLLALVRDLITHTLPV